MFFGEHKISLQAMHGNGTLSHCEREVSWFFSGCGRNLEYILKFPWVRSCKARVFSARSGLLSSYEGHLRNHLKACQGNTDVYRVEVGDKGSLSS